MLGFDGSQEPAHTDGLSLLRFRNGTSGDVLNLKAPHHANGLRLNRTSYPSIAALDWTDAEF